MAVEDALDEALVGSQLGAVISGGTGRIYSYIDLALAEVRPAIAVIRDVLRKGNIPVRTWLLFHDGRWRNEWLGVWEDTPAPPPWPEQHASSTRR